jgi:hypothetical protein
MRACLGSQAVAWASCPRVPNNGAASAWARCPSHSDASKRREDASVFGKSGSGLGILPKSSEQQGRNILGKDAQATRREDESVFGKSGSGLGILPKSSEQQCSFSLGKMPKPLWRRFALGKMPKLLWRTQEARRCERVWKVRQCGLGILPKSSEQRCCFSLGKMPKPLWRRFALGKMPKARGDDWVQFEPLVNLRRGARSAPLQCPKH